MTSIGVIGYSSDKFDFQVAAALLSIALKVVEEKHPDTEYELVSGLFVVQN